MMIAVLVAAAVCGCMGETRVLCGAGEEGQDHAWGFQGHSSLISLHALRSTLGRLHVRAGGLYSFPAGGALSSAACTASSVSSVLSHLRSLSLSSLHECQHLIVYLPSCSSVVSSYSTMLAPPPSSPSPEPSSLLYHFYLGLGVPHTRSYLLESGTQLLRGDPLSLMGLSPSATSLDASALAYRLSYPSLSVSSSGVYRLASLDSRAVLSTSLPRILHIVHPITSADYYVSFFSNASEPSFSALGQLHSVTHLRTRQPYYIQTLSPYGLPFVDFTNSFQVQQLLCSPSNLTCDFQLQFACQLASPVISVSAASPIASLGGALFYDASDPSSPLQLSAGDGRSGICWPGYTHLSLEDVPSGMSAKLSEESLFLQPGQRCLVSLETTGSGVLSIRATSEDTGLSSVFSLGVGCPSDPEASHVVLPVGYQRTSSSLRVDFQLPSASCVSGALDVRPPDCPGWSVTSQSSTHATFEGPADPCDALAFLGSLPVPVIEPCSSDFQVAQEQEGEVLTVRVTPAICHDDEALRRMLVASQWRNGSLPDALPLSSYASDTVYPMEPLQGIPEGSLVAEYHDSTLHRFIVRLSQDANLTSSVGHVPVSFSVDKWEEPPCVRTAPRANYYCLLPNEVLLEGRASTYCQVTITSLDSPSCPPRLFSARFTNTLDIPMVVGPAVHNASLASGWAASWRMDMDLSNVTLGDSLAVDTFVDEYAPYRSPTTRWVECERRAPLLAPGASEIRIALSQTVVVPLGVTVRHSSFTCGNAYAWAWDVTPVGTNFSALEFSITGFGAFSWRPGQFGTFGVVLTALSPSLPVDTPFDFALRLSDVRNASFSSVWNFTVTFVDEECKRRPFVYEVERVSPELLAWNVSVWSNDTLACDSHEVDVRLLDFPVPNPDQARVYVQQTTFNPGWWSFESSATSVRLVPGASEPQRFSVLLSHSDGAPPGQLSFPLSLSPKDSQVLHRAESAVHELPTLLPCPLPPPVVSFIVTQYQPLFSPTPGVRLRWTAPCSKARCCHPLQYFVYRNDQLVQAVNSTRWEDEDVVAGVDYYYRVLTRDAEGQSNTENSCNPALRVRVKAVDPWPFVLLFFGILIFVILCVIIAVLIYKTRKIDLEIRRLQRLADMQELNRIRGEDAQEDASGTAAAKTTNVVKVLSLWEPRDMDDLEVRVGDEILVLKEEAPGQNWWRGKLLPEGPEGYFDVRCTKVLPPSLPSGMAEDFDGDTEEFEDMPGGEDEDEKKAFF